MNIIYMRISPSGGRYIGKTNEKEEERWKKHCYEALTPSNANYNTLLNKAIRKYGKNNFSVKILETNITDDKINEREQYWIEYYKTYYLDNNHGYNMTRGGEGTIKIKIDDQQLLDCWKQGLSTPEISKKFNCDRQIIRKRLLALGITSEELVIRRGEHYSKNFVFERYDADKILSEWQEGYSLGYIANENDLDYRTIKRILLRCGIPEIDFLRKSIYKNNPMRNAKHRKVVLQYDLENNLIHEWESVTQAEKTLHIQHISEVANGKRKTAGGYIFKYKEIN